MLRPFVSTRFQVLFHSLHQGSFHLSLTVLVRYRSSNVFSLGRWTSQLPTELACSVVLRVAVEAPASFAYGTVTLCGASFQSASTTSRCFLRQRPTTPPVHDRRFGLFPFRSPLLRESFLFLKVLRCFSSLRSPCSPIFSDRSAGGWPRRVSPFGHPRILRLHTAPRGFSQCTTSFFGI